MRRAAKVDTIHADVRDVFRAHGVIWKDCYGVGGGWPDALVCWNGRLAFIEVKSGAKADKRKSKTATAQQEFARDIPVCRVTSLRDADVTIQWLKGPR